MNGDERFTVLLVDVVVITAYGEWTRYFEAMNLGAMDYLTKPVRSGVVDAGWRE